jgi:hypothetical protein
MNDINGQNASLPQHCTCTKALPLLVLARPRRAHQEPSSSRHLVREEKEIRP